MRIISNFKFNTNEYVDMLAKPGDVVLRGDLRCIRTNTGYVTEYGTTIKGLVIFNRFCKNTVLIKRDVFSLLEDMLIEAEKFNV